jgi:hypothetical protein
MQNEDRGESEMGQKNGMTNLICHGVRTLLQIKQSLTKVIRKYHCQFKNIALSVIENATKCRGGVQ